MNKRIGFTLAEVLITLGIIGIVAEMTIPTLMNNIKDVQYKTGWKKAFSVFSQATAQIATDNGGSLSGLFASSSDIVDKYSEYLRKATICTDSIAEGCRASIIQFLTKDGLNRVINGKGIILADGSYFQPWFSSTTCQAPVGTPVIFNRCGGAIVDVNGPKKPNVFGIDVFEFHILENRILPYGTQGDGLNITTECSPTGNGESCSAKYLYE